MELLVIQAYALQQLCVIFLQSQWKLETPTETNFASFGHSRNCGRNQRHVYGHNRTLGRMSRLSFGRKRSWSRNSKAK